MSGSGGDGGPPVDDRTSNCSTLIFETVLNSPNPSVLSRLKPKDVLHVAVQQSGGPVLALDKSGKIAGSITSTHLATLLRCLDEGYEYVAIVRTVKSGICNVQVRPEVRT